MPIMNAVGVEQGGIVGIQRDGVNVNLDGGTLVIGMLLALLVFYISLRVIFNALLMAGLAILVYQSVQLNKVKKILEIDATSKFVQRMKKSSLKVNIQSGLEFYKLNSKKKVYQNFRHFEVGEKNDSIKRLIVLIVGMTGSGKTSLVNTIANHVFGVCYSHDFRFVLANENDEGDNTSHGQSKTATTTAYTLHHQEGFRTPYTLTVVDTPGYGDTRGFERDEAITEQILSILKSKDVFANEELASICYAIKSSDSRATIENRYCTDMTLQLFGENAKNNLNLFLTFSDGQASPALDVIKTDKVLRNLSQRFLINNAAVFSEKSKTTEISYQRNETTLDDYLQQLEVISPMKLTATIENLTMREKFGALLQQISLKITKSLNTYMEIGEIIRYTKDINVDIQTTKSDIITVISSQKEKEKTQAKASNCTKCKTTCHFPCDEVCRADTGHCSMIDESGCSVCYSCKSASHEVGKFKYAMHKKKKEIVLQEVYQQYKTRLEEKNSKQKVLEGLIDDYNAANLELIDLLFTAEECSRQIDSISLRNSNKSKLQYINNLIESEEKSVDSVEKRTKLRCLQTMKKAVTELESFKEKDGFPVDKAEEERQLLQQRLEKITAEILSEFNFDDEYKDILQRCKRKRAEQTKSFIERWIARIERIWGKTIYGVFLSFWDNIFGKN